MRAVTLALSLVVLVSCSTHSDGPTPALGMIMPGQVCVAQGPIQITLTGTGFSPEVQNGLATPIVVLPRVLLVSGGTSTEVPPADISLPDTTGTTLVVSVPQSLVQPGTYDVEVINPNTNSTTLAGSLKVDAPPTITSVVPNSGKQGTTVTVTITGTNLLPGMTVTLGTTPPITGTVTMVSADGTTATVTFDLTGVATGTYDVTINNNDGCSVTLPGGFTVTNADLAIIGIDPPFGCTCSTTNVTISAPTGSFVSTPRVEMRPAGQASPVYDMKRVAFVDSKTITAVVPAGLPLGMYDVTVYNPPSDGRSGTLANAFRVVQLPVPEITQVVPSRAPPSTAVTLDVYGSNFRDVATLSLLGANAAVAAGPVNCTFVTASHLTCALTTPSTLGPYLVRVTNTDEMTYSTWSAFIVGSEGASGKLNAFAAEGNLVTGRRMLGGVGAEDDLGNFFVYAIAGDTGGATPTVLDTVEVAQISKFGALAAWAQEKPSQNLTTTRDAPIAVAVPLPQSTDPCVASGLTCFPPVKTYVYVLGGRSGAGTVLGSIERAMVLRNGDAPAITTSAASATAGSLAAGTWYYKVSAMMPAGDADNPGGETLPSDEAIITLGSSQTAIDLAWNAVPNAVGYKVYRTAAVNGASQKEVLIASPTGTTYTDTGAAAGTEVPLPPGSLGTWKVQTSTLGTARWGHQGAVVTDNQGAAGGRSIYVLGGMSDNLHGLLDSVERLPIGSTGTLGTATSTNDIALPAPIAFFSLVVESASNVSGFASGASGAPARFITLGGMVTPVAGNAASADLNFCSVTSGGGNGTWNAYSGAGSSLTRGGDMAVIASNKLFWLGGAGSGTLDPPAFTNIRANGENVAFTSTGTLGTPIQSTANAFPANANDALGVAISNDNFIYFVGGTSDGTNAVNLTFQTF